MKPLEIIFVTSFVSKFSIDVPGIKTGFCKTGIRILVIRSKYRFLYFDKLSGNLILSEKMVSHVKIAQKTPVLELAEVSIF